MNIFEEIRTQLKEQAEDKYRDFNKSLIPGESLKVLGVRLPKLREIAKGLAKDSGRQYIEAVKLAEKQGDVYHEELLLHGILIGYLKCDNAERRKLLDDFVPIIDNWAVCDSSCTTYKFMKKDMDCWYQYIMQYFSSDKEYKLRFAVVCMLNHFINDEYIDSVLEKLGEIRHDAYYVKMAVAWAVSVCYVRFPKKTWNLLESNKLDDETHKKALQKIRDSYRVSKDEKDKINTLKRQS